MEAVSIELTPTFLRFSAEHEQQQEKHVQEVGRGMATEENKFGGGGGGPKGKQKQKPPPPLSSS